MPSLTPLSELTNADVLRDLRRRVREMKALEEDGGQGYGPCIEFYERILECTPELDYEPLYHAAAKGVTKRNTEIERLQREIYNMLPHDEATAIINDCDMWVGRPVLRDKENVKLKQSLDAARKVRDELVAQKRNEHVVDWAYRIVSAQGAVNQAKKALYMYLQKTSKSRYSHQNIKHRDL